MRDKRVNRGRKEKKGNKEWTMYRVIKVEIERKKIKSDAGNDNEYSYRREKKGDRLKK